MTLKFKSCLFISSYVRTSVANRGSFGARYRAPNLSSSNLVVPLASRQAISAGSWQHAWHSCRAGCTAISENSQGFKDGVSPVQTSLKGITKLYYYLLSFFLGIFLFCRKISSVPIFHQFSPHFEKKILLR